MSSLPVEVDLDRVDLPTEVVRTQRLVLRPHRPDDQAAVFAACQDPDIQRWLHTLPSPYTQEDARTYVTALAPGERTEGTALSVAIERDGMLVGSGGLHLRPSRLGPEIGYWIAPQARGNGYAAEATRGLAEWAFAHGAPRVHLFVDVGNEPSQVVARRAGFTQEGLVRACIPYRDGGRGDALLFSRLSGG